MNYKSQEVKPTKHNLQWMNAHIKSMLMDNIQTDRKAEKYFNNLTSQLSSADQINFEVKQEDGIGTKQNIYEEDNDDLIQPDNDDLIEPDNDLIQPDFDTSEMNENNTVNNQNSDLVEEIEQEPKRGRRVKMAKRNYAINEEQIQEDMQDNHNLQNVNEQGHDFQRKKRQKNKAPKKRQKRFTKQSLNQPLSSFQLSPSQHSVPLTLIHIFEEINRKLTDLTDNYLQIRIDVSTIMNTLQIASDEVSNPNEVTANKTNEVSTEKANEVSAQKPKRKPKGKKTEVSSGNQMIQMLNIVKEAVRDGKSFKDVGQKYNIHHQTVKHWANINLKKIREANKQLD